MAGPPLNDIIVVMRDTGQRNARDLYRMQVKISTSTLESLCPKCAHASPALKCEHGSPLQPRAVRGSDTSLPSLCRRVS